MGKFVSLEDARKATLLSSYEKLANVEFGSVEFLKGAQAISELEKSMSERYKSDRDYASKVKVAEMDGDLRKDIAKIDADAKCDAAHIDAEVRRDISKRDAETKIKMAEVDSNIKREVAEIDAAIRKQIADQDVETKQKIANIEAETEDKKRNMEVSTRTVESGIKLLLSGAQLVIFMEELSKTRAFETTAVEVSSAFRKLWTMFKPFGGI